MSITTEHQRFSPPFFYFYDPSAHAPLVDVCFILFAAHLSGMTAFCMTVGRRSRRRRMPGRRIKMKTHSAALLIQVRCARGMRDRRLRRVSVAGFRQARDPHE